MVIVNRANSHIWQTAISTTIRYIINGTVSETILLFAYSLRELQYRSPAPPRDWYGGHDKPWSHIPSYNRQRFTCGSQLQKNQISKTHLDGWLSFLLGSASGCGLFHRLKKALFPRPVTTHIISTSPVPLSGPFIRTSQFTHNPNSAQTSPAMALLE